MEKEGFETFMLKEIHEQPAAIGETLSQLALPRCRPAPSGCRRALREVRRIPIVACGTSYPRRAGGQDGDRAVGAGPGRGRCRVGVPLPRPDHRPRTRSCSGSPNPARRRTRWRRCGSPASGGRTSSRHQRPGSQATRDADAVLFTRAGLEMGVAATKTFVAQVALLYEFALRLAARRGASPPSGRPSCADELELLPERVDRSLARIDPSRDSPSASAWSPFFLYLGRLAGLPVRSRAR